MPDDSATIEKLTGTFAAYSLAPRSANVLAAWAAEMGVPNPVAAKDLHLTTVYSRTPVPAYSPNGLPGMLLLADGFGLEHFGTALVLTVTAEWLMENAEHAKSLGATSDFPSYRPHITLSYDAPDFMPETPPPFALRLGDERVEDLRKMLRAMTSVAVMISKGWNPGQARVPAGGPHGGQFAGKGGTGMVGDIQAPHLGMQDGMNVATGDPYPMTAVRPTDVDFNDNPHDLAVYVKGYDPGSLDGARFDRWTPPGDWSRVEGQDPKLVEGNLITARGKSIGSGVIITEPDGRIWMVEPTNHFGGYENTFPKGTAEAGLSLQANAIKETYEESGLKVRITGVLGDYERTTSVARFYLAERTGGTPTGAGPESQAVKLAPLHEARRLANKPVDQKILDDYEAHIAARPAPVAKAMALPLLRVIAQAMARVVEKVKGPDGYNRWPAGSSKGGEFAPKGVHGGGAGVGGGGAAAAAKATQAPPGAFQHQLMTGKNPDNTALISANKAIAHYGSLANKADVAGLAAAMPPDPSKQASGGNGYTKAKFAQWQAAMTHAIAQSNKPVTAATGTDQTPMKLSAMTQVGAKPGGSAKGAIYKDADGQKWLVKSYPSSDQAKNEVLAANLYKRAGIDAPEMKLVDLDGQFHGGIGVASKFEDGTLSKFDPSNPVAVAKAQEGFAVDAWLSNWDVVGLSNDNLLSRPDGSLVRIDPGGALLYRAQGSLKGDAFGETVGEWDSLRGIGPNANAQAAQAFGKMTPEAMAKSADRVLFIPNADIRAIVAKYGPGDEAAKTALADKLIARKSDLVNKALTVAPASFLAPPPPVAAAPSPKTEGKPAVPTFTGEAATFYDKQVAKIAAMGEGSDFIPKMYVPSSAGAHGSDNYKAYQQFYHDSFVAAASSGKPIEPPSIFYKGSGSVTGAEKAKIDAQIDKDPKGVDKVITADNYAYVAAKMVEQGHGDVNIGYISATKALNDLPASHLFEQTGLPNSLGKDNAVALLHSKGDLHNQINAIAGKPLSADLTTFSDADLKITINTDHLAAAKAAAQSREPTKMPDTPMTQGVPLPNYGASKLPDDNTNAPTFNSQVDKLAGQAAAGDVHGILNTTYGTNTYGKKLAALANNTLVALGHPALVSPGMNTKSDPAKGTYKVADGWGGAKSGGLTAEALAQVAPKVAPPKVKVEPPKPVFRESDLPKPVDFNNWNGAGKGLSSKPAVNDQNSMVAKALYDAAKTGDIAKINAMYYQPINAAGKPEGLPKPISSHPSQHIRDYQTMLAQNIHDQLNPAAPPRKMAVGATFADLSSKAEKLDYKQAANWSDKIGHRYSVVGNPGVVNEKALGIDQHIYAGVGYNGGDKVYNASRTAFDKLTATERNAIVHYTGGGYDGMTSALTSGKLGPNDQAKMALNGLAKASQPIPKGMILKRFHSLDEAGIAKMKSSIGKAILDPSITSTSVKPDFHWPGNVMLRMVTGEGVKALYAGRNPKTYTGQAISQHANEMEMIMQPSTRYLIQNVRPSHALTPEEHANGFTAGGAKWIIDVVVLPTD
jgi:ADP-ribose pyrophosphatase YjhB (NUDIX family)